MVAAQQEVGEGGQVGVRLRARHLGQHVVQLIVADVFGAAGEPAVPLVAPFLTASGHTGIEE